MLVDALVSQRDVFAKKTVAFSGNLALRLLAAARVASDAVPHRAS